MDYATAVDWLMHQLPMFQKSGASAYRADLGNIVQLCNQLNQPQQQFPSIHIAGTNGKGSTSHMLASILQTAGYKTGLTTSPHLKDFRERIRIDGALCNKAFVASFTEQHFELIQTLEASFFEVAIAMAFAYFAQEKVDIAVVETGLGGRLDSTNILQPKLSIITNIGLDHQAILGDTLEQIAQEKAGIIKENTPIIIGETTKETQSIFVNKAKEKHAPLIFAEELAVADYASDLKGIYQIKNRKTVLAAVNELRKQGFEISEKAVEEGLKNVVKNTGLRGRWEVLSEKPLVVADTAHNAHGLVEIQKQIQQANYRNLHLVLGFVNDKDVESILRFFPKNATYYFCAPEVERKLPMDELKKIIGLDLCASYHNSVAEALSAAQSKADLDDLVYVGGSTFVVAEVI